MNKNILAFVHSLLHTFSKKNGILYLLMLCLY